MNDMFKILRKTTQRFKNYHIANRNLGKRVCLGIHVKLQKVIKF